MTEEDFRKQIIKAIRAEKYHLIDISDELKRTLSILCPQDRVKVSGMVREKPYDLAYFTDGIFVAMELKLIKEGFTFPYSRIELHQLQSLKEVVNEGGKGFIGVCFCKTLTSEQQKKFSITNRLLYEVYMIPISFVEIELLRDRKSITLLELRTKGFAIPLFISQLGIGVLTKR